MDQSLFILHRRKVSLNGDDDFSSTISSLDPPPPKATPRPIRTATPLETKPDADTKHFVCQNRLCKNRCHKNHQFHHCVGFIHTHDGCEHHCGDKNRCKRCKKEKHDLRQCNRCGEHYCKECCME